MFMFYSPISEIRSDLGAGVLEEAVLFQAARQKVNIVL